jgi:hypothetical protein
MTNSFLRSLLVLLCLTIVSASSGSQTTWFKKHVTWRGGTNPRVWEVPVSNPKGTESYRLAIIPLWAVEGGIVSIEFLVAPREHPDDNLLGKRASDVAKPFVITVEELERGINQSQFVRTRVFDLGQTKFRIDVVSSRLGKGVGECSTCENIQEITVDLSFASKESRDRVN